MKLRNPSILLALAISWSANSVGAQTRDFGSAGDFDVAGKASTRDEPGLCIATFEYEGPGSTKTTVMRRPDPEDRDLVFLTITNYEWSAEAGKSYDLEYVFGDKFYARSALGVKVDYIYKGFIAAFPADEFLQNYAKSESLHIFLGEAVVDKLSLKGSSAGIALFNKCWSWLLGTERAAEAERKKFEDIPRDPFAQEGDGDE